MYHVWIGFKFALSYFTIVPVRLQHGEALTHPKTLNAMLFFLPLIGAFLAAASILLYWALGFMGVFAGVIAGVGYMLLYGFIHTEAVCDVADAIYAKHGGKDAYEVIKQPGIGAMGMLYAVSVVIVKTAVVNWVLADALFVPFVLSAVGSRFALLVLIKRVQFRSSFVGTLQKALAPSWLIAAGVCSFGLAFLLGGFFGIATVFAAVVIAAMAANILRKKLGFANGDVLGTTLEITEIITLLSAAALWP